MYYYSCYSYKRLKGFQTLLGETFLSSKEFKYLLLTNLINVVHAPPFFEKQYILKRIGQVTRFSISTLLSNLMFMRVYLVLRLIPNLSQWRDMHAEECCEKEGIKADGFFALKSLLKEKPY